MRGMKKKGDERRGSGREETKGKTTENRIIKEGKEIDTFKKYIA